MHADRIREMDRVRASAQDENGEYSIAPMVSLATHMLTTEGLVGETAEAGFSGAWAHPCGGQGIVAGWRVSLADGKRRGG